MPSLPIRMVKLAPSILLPKDLFAAIRGQQPLIRVAAIVVESAALAPARADAAVLRGAHAGRAEVAHPAAVGLVHGY